MQIAVSGTDLHSTDSISKLIVLAKAVKVQFIELWYPMNIEAEGLERSIDMISKANIKVACISTPSELYRSGGSRDDQNLLIRAIDLAHQIGSPLVNTYFGSSSVQDDERAINVYIEYLKPCLDRARELGVTIVLENEFDTFGTDSAGSDITRRPIVLHKLVNQVGSPNFKITFDPCNYYFAGVEPFPYAYEVLHSQIGNVHVKDGSIFNSKARSDMESWKLFRDFGREFNTQPLGQGAINWSGLLLKLKEDDYTGFLTLEPHNEGKSLSQWSQAANSLRRYFKALEIYERT